MCIADGTIFDAEVIGAWLAKRRTNPVNGEPLAAKDLIKLNFTRSADAEGDTTTSNQNGVITTIAGVDREAMQGDLIDPVSYKVFTNNTHIVAIRHGSYANVFSWDTINNMNIRAKMWRDLLDDKPFTRADIITLQDPHGASAMRDPNTFMHLKEKESILPASGEGKKNDGLNVSALGRMGDKVLRAREAVERTRRQREAGGDVNRSSGRASAVVPSCSSKLSASSSFSQERKKTHANAAVYTTGKAAASLTSTGITPSTTSDRAVLSDEEFMLLRRGRIKHKGYARIETSLGDLNLELRPDFSPRAVFNFIRLAQRGSYRDVAFHRNIPGFMIQGGDPTGTGRGGTSVWGKNFADEFAGSPLVHDARGIVSMANKGRDTNSSQFFIIYKPCPHLDHKHTVFGSVLLSGDTESTATLQRMEQSPTDASNRPLEDIVIRDVIVYIDPFEEFLKERNANEAREEEQARKKAEGDDEDEKFTWTGKRIRSGGETLSTDTREGVGKYLREAIKAQVGAATRRNVSSTDEKDVEPWDKPGHDEPARKKFKGNTSGGFGNFDGW